MAECGNKHKAASYRQRKKQEAVLETGA
ncbi:hypothetical protein SMALA_7676 [Streptomyces malaysiensis subsp. malaysiensis]|nr:hypothetical protein SMALA_7676 [Streptomyces malaysiensis]